MRFSKLAAWNNQALGVAAGLILFSVFPKGAHGEGTISRSPAGQHRSHQSWTLLVGQAEVVRFAREPGTVIIGDPKVATASLATSDILVLTGLEAGETNLIVLDDSGVQIGRMMLRVVDRGETVVLRRGVERVVFRCHPLCLPIATPGAAQAAAEASSLIEGAVSEARGGAIEGAED